MYFAALFVARLRRIAFPFRRTAVPDRVVGPVGPSRPRRASTVPVDLQPLAPASSWTAWEVCRLPGGKPGGGGGKRA